MNTPPLHSVQFKFDKTRAEKMTGCFRDNAPSVASGAVALEVTPAGYMVSAPRLRAANGNGTRFKIETATTDELLREQQSVFLGGASVVAAMSLVTNTKRHNLSLKKRGKNGFDRVEKLDKGIEALRMSAYLAAYSLGQVVEEPHSLKVEPSDKNVTRVTIANDTAAVEGKLVHQEGAFVWDSSTEKWLDAGRDITGAYGFLTTLREKVQELRYPVKHNEDF